MIYVTCSCTPNRYLLGYIDCCLRSIEIREKDYVLRKACPWADLGLLLQHRPQSSYNSLATSSPFEPPNKPNPDEEVFVLLEFGDELERKTKVADFQKVIAVFGKYVVHPRVRPCFEYHAHFSSETQSMLQIHTPRRDLACASKPYRLSEARTPRSGTLPERYQDRRHCSRLGKGERCRVWYHQRRWGP